MKSKRSGAASWLAAAVTVVLIAGVALAVWFAGPARQPHAGGPETSANVPAARPDDAPGVPPMHAEASEAEADYPGAIAGLADRAEAERHLSFLSKERLRDSRLIRYRYDTLRHLQPNDRFDLYLPNLDTVVSARLHAREDGNGWSRWRGALLDADGAPAHRFLITEAPSDRYAVAYLETPDGAMHLEAKNGYGWMRPAGFDHRHESTPPDDALIPPADAAPPPLSKENTAR